MNTLPSKYKHITKGSQVDVSLDANLAASKSLGVIQGETGKPVTLKAFYSRLVETAIRNPSIVKATIQSFTKPKQVA